VVGIVDEEVEGGRFEAADDRAVGPIVGVAVGQMDVGGCDDVAG
jgi:hypothetical protein